MKEYLECIVKLQHGVEVGDRKELIRCENCRWWHESETNKGHGDCGQANGITMKPSNWFCADGKRKET